MQKGGSSYPFFLPLLKMSGYDGSMGGTFARLADTDIAKLYIKMISY